MTPAEKAKETRRKNREKRAAALDKSNSIKEKVSGYLMNVLESPASTTGEKLKACELLLYIAR